MCFTFDDCNPSQYDVAVPVLEKYKIKAFFFFITSPYDGHFDKTELFRFFRFLQFLRWYLILLINRLDILFDRDPIHKMLNLER